ncbi:MAG: prolipoprotein diacylglyceryl transferase [Saprospiraceae bacterium]|nr:prolipoprotein diacylglyceryl transferase [Saprospiraceae bacterium]
MYPDLSYLLHDLIGTPVDNAFSIIKTFGFVLAFAFLAARYVFGKELLRMEKLGLLQSSKERVKIGYPATTTEIIINALVGFFIGFKVVYLIGHQQEIGSDILPFIASMKGNWLGGLIGGGLFGFLQWYGKQKERLPKPVTKDINVHPHERKTDITIRSAISGILGAKIFAIFESSENVRAFFQDPIGQFFSGSGLAIYGGLIVAFFYILWYVKKKGMNPIHVMDAAAPAMIMGYAVGRIGCQLAGDGDWGIVNDLAQPSWWFLPDWMWAYDYPRNVLNQGVPIEGCVGHYCHRLANPVFPTPFYEVIASLIIFVILWSLRNRIKIPGMIFFIYVILNGFERFWIEKIRVNDEIHFLGMHPSQAEIISFILFFVGIVGCWVVYSRYKSGLKT